MLHLVKHSSMICRGIACWKKTISNFLKGTLQKNDTCFFATRGGFIVVFNITFRTGMQYVRFMLHTATETHIPFKGRLYFSWGKSCIFEKDMWYFGRSSGKVHATISMVLRCKYISIYLFLNCVYLKWSSTFWLWCIYYIACIKGNTIHKVTLKQKLWLCMGIA